MARDARHGTLFLLLQPDRISFVLLLHDKEKSYSGTLETQILGSCRGLVDSSLQTSKDYVVMWLRGLVPSSPVDTFVHV